MKKKSFNCVEMKNNIQRHLIQEMQGLSAQDRQSFRDSAIQSDPLLGPLWRRMHPGKQVKA